MPPRPVLLLVIFITLVEATFRLPGGLAEVSVLKPTVATEPKRGNAADELVERSPSNSAQPNTDSTTPTFAPDDDSTAIISATPEAAPDSEEVSPKPLTLGSKGDSVRELQAVLKRLGYYYGTVNGVLGKDTQTAVNRFQKEAGLLQTKDIDAATLENLKQAERSLASQKRIVITPEFEADSVPSRSAQAGATAEFPGDTLSTPASPTATQEQGVGEIGWMGWVMGSLAGLAIAGSLVYGLYRSGNRLELEEADYSLSGVDTSKIFEERLAENQDVSSQTAGSLNGSRGAEDGGDAGKWSEDAGRKWEGDEDGGRSLAAATLMSGSDLPSLLTVKLGQSEFIQSASNPASNQSEPIQSEPSLPELAHADRFYHAAESTSNSSVSDKGEGLAVQSVEPDALNETTRIPKLSLVDQLINDLHSTDPVKRRGAIWELGQEGDSRAVQPLVDLMLEADSQQRTLILAAIAEISIRTLKPMKRALLTSLQDENSDVRKNAIRDTTRVYDMMAQLSQLLSHAVNDSDPEVQDTAHWAMAQLSRLRPNLSDSGSTSPEYDRDQER